ncbi:hypothetical protein [Tissierella praeacuta]|uniref:hypothetical protein n=1 Tax=Tissierella praeacuta TaxID=43131 RepID=UPI003340560D
MLFDRKNITRSLMIVLSIIFVFSITSDAKSSNLKSPRRPPADYANNLNLFQNLKSKVAIGESCEDCYDDIYRGIETIYARTDKAGGNCKHCSTQDYHLTKVYARRKSSMCPNGCTYKDVEYLPTLYECISLLSERD